MCLHYITDEGNRIKREFYTVLNLESVFSIVSQSKSIYGTLAEDAHATGMHDKRNRYAIQDRTGHELQPCIPSRGHAHEENAAN